MNKSQGWAIVFGIVVLCIAIGYYLIVYLPKTNSQKFLLAQQEKCLEIGQQAYKADLKQYGVSDLEEPQYGYSKKLNTCIYSSGYHYAGNPSSGTGGEIFTHNCDEHWERWVKNSYTNEKILDVSNFLYKCEWVTKTEEIEKYEADRQILFAS